LLRAKVELFDMEQLIRETMNDHCVSPKNSHGFGFDFCFLWRIRIIHRYHATGLLG